MTTPITLASIYRHFGFKDIGNINPMMERFQYTELPDLQISIHHPKLTATLTLDMLRVRDMHEHYWATLFGHAAARHFRDKYCKPSQRILRSRSQPDLQPLLKLPTAVATDM